MNISKSNRCHFDNQIKRNPTMKIKPIIIQRAALLLVFLILSARFAARGQGTAFSYQGRLNNNGAIANGFYDFQFTISDAVSSGVQIGGTLTTNVVSVSNRLFTVTLDFGASVFTGANRRLNIAVTTNGAGNFTPLTPA